MNHPPLAPGHLDAPHRAFALGDLVLESGETIVDYRQSFVVHGALNADRSNAILVCPALTATHHRLDFLIGEGNALDPARWCIVAADPIGNGLSTSPSNSATQPGMRFPRFALRDMVAAQRRLLTEHLGIDRLHAVVGASMGGMQALQWGVSHPGFMRRVVAMTPMARTAPWAALVLAASGGAGESCAVLSLAGKPAAGPASRPTAARIRPKSSASVASCSASGARSTAVTAETTRWRGGRSDSYSRATSPALTLMLFIPSVELISARMSRAAASVSSRWARRPTSAGPVASSDSISAYPMM